MGFTDGSGSSAAGYIVSVSSSRPLCIMMCVPCSMTEGCQKRENYCRMLD